MKKSILFLLAAIISLPLYARDFEYTYEGQTLKYTVLDEEAKTCETKEGAYDEIYGYQPGNIVEGNLIIPSIAKDGDTEYTVTSIGSFSFFKCKDIKSVTIPGSAISINTYAFGYCEAMIDVSMGSSINSIEESAFSWCSSLAEITLPNNIQSIGKYAFSGCNKLSSIIIPASVTYLGKDAFECDQLKEVYYNAEDCKVDYDYSYYLCPFSTSIEKVIIGNNVKTLPPYIFYECSLLTTVVIPESVTSIGNSAFSGTSLTEVYFNAKNCEETGNYSFPTTLQRVYIGDQVRCIPKSAFYKCNDLTEITLPASVESIGSYAFAQSGLTSIVLPNSVKNIGESAFSYCEGLNSISLPQSITEIANGTFYHCTKLSSVTIPESVTSIGEEAFINCTSLTSITIPDSVVSIGKNTFKDCNNLEEVIFNAVNCESCGSPSFPSTLKKVTFGNTVKRIPDNAFYGCSDLTTVNIPNSVNSIGSYAFSGCSGITEIEFPESVTEIGQLAFQGASITSLTIPASISSIGQCAFLYCKDLKEVYFYIEDCSAVEENIFPDTLQKFVFGDNIKRIPSNLLRWCTELTEIDIPNSVTSIGEDAFYGCSGLKSLRIGDSVTSIEKRAFGQCKSLTTVEIPNSVTSIESMAFNGCEELSDLTLGDSVRFIGEAAFGGCSSLTTVVIPPSVTTIGNSTFTRCNNLEEVVFNAVECKIEKASEKSQLFPENVKKVVIGEQVTYIPVGAFSGCTNLTEVVFNAENCKATGEYFKNELYPIFPSTVSTVRYGDNVKIIPNDVFYNCSGLKELIIGNSVTTIGKAAFWQCSNLTEVKIPNSVVIIGADAFANCKNIKELCLPDSLYSIGDGAFYGCLNIPEVKIPNTVVAIGYQAFYGCHELKDIIIPSSVTDIGGRAFSDCKNLKKVYYYAERCTTHTSQPFSYSVEEAIIGDNVEKIPANLFRTCNITSITIPGSVTYIGDNAFDYCKSLTNVEIQNPQLWSQINFATINANPISFTGHFTVNGIGVQHLDIDDKDGMISDYAFYNAQNLNTIRIQAKTIGESSFYNCSNVTDLCIKTNEIYTEAFASCSNLKTIYCMTQDPPQAFFDIFSNYEGVTLYVPKGSLSKYKDPNVCWGNFENIIETDFAGIDEIFKADYENSGNPDAVDCIFDDFANSEIDFSAPLEVYTLNGARIADSTDNLAPGIYILRQGNATKKIAIK